MSKFSEQALRPSCSEQVVLSASCSEQVSSIRETLSYLKVAIFQPELRKLLCVLLWYSKVAIFQPELRKFTSRTTFVLRSCEFPAGAAKVYVA